MNSWTLRPWLVARALATIWRCASFGPIRATAMPFEALFSACGLCALFDISALALMILDPLICQCRSLKPLLAVSLQLWSRHGARPTVAIGHGLPIRTIGIANGSGKKSTAPAN